MSRQTSRNSRPTQAWGLTAETEVWDKFEQAEQEHQMWRLQNLSKAVGTAAVVSRWEHGVANFRFACRRALTPRFELVVLVFIVTDAICVGLSVQVAAMNRADPPDAFRVITTIFCALFTFELVLRVSGTSDFWTGPNRGWHYVDVLVVVASIVEVFVSAAGSSQDDQEKRVNQLRLVRIFRTIRVFRVVRAMRLIRSFRLLLHSLLNTGKSLLWTMVLLLSILYVFAIVFTEAVSEYVIAKSPSRGSSLTLDARLNRLELFWGDVPKSIFTLYKAIAGGISWHECAAPLQEIQLHMVWIPLFVGFIALIQLAVLNVVTGVFCQTAIESAVAEKEFVLEQEKANADQHEKELRTLFGCLDTDSSGAVTIHEFEDGLGNEGVKGYFASFGISVDDAWNLFKLIDRDGSGLVALDEFVDGCMKLKGLPRNTDIMLMRYEVMWLMSKVAACTEQLEKKTMWMPSQFKLHCGPLEPPSGCTPPQEDAARQTVVIDCAGSSSADVDEDSRTEGLDDALRNALLEQEGFVFHEEVTEPNFAI